MERSVAKVIAALGVAPAANKETEGVEVALKSSPTEKGKQNVSHTFMSIPELERQKIALFSGLLFANI